MKKIISLLLILLCLVGCSSESYPSPDLSTNFELETYLADMSGYENLKSTGHMFKGTTVSELKRTVDEKGYGVFVLSRTTCSHCQLALQYLNAVAEELGVYVYYIDAESDTYPILGTDNYNVLYEILEPVLEKDDNGEKAIQTPDVFTIVDGEITANQIGTTWTGSNYDDKDVEELKAVYTKMLKPFSSVSQD